MRVPNLWKESQRELLALALVASAAAVIAYRYFSLVDRPNLVPRLTLHQQILAGTAPSPYRYRMLAPLSAELLRRVLNILGARQAFLLAYAIYDLVAILFSLIALYLWVRRWFSWELSLIGVLFIASTMPIALQNHYFQPWSLLEAGFFSLALLAIRAKRYGCLALLVLLATLNRETAVFIPLTLFVAYLEFPGVSSRQDWKPLLLSLALLLEWAMVYGALRCLQGNAPHGLTVQALLTKNLSRINLLLALVHGGLFFGCFWLFVILGYRDAPPFVRRAARVLPLYLLAIAIWGVWYEVRLLMPLYPFLLPLGVSFLQHKLRTLPSAEGRSLHP